ncbi:hypothetical protein [Mycobacterium sp. ACS4331]|uniref:hypothetical protein n=1 Tax=Mycobacterium sp. ACS4331 TaxID=1834121 RepID=UPI0007FC64B6|nr:hypothetical protein [Mycobacterium sp. ACS4331]OBF26144.1 hypothetical protein A5727_03555 [Mycobacterium sp. ACS4331]
MTAPASAPPQVQRPPWQERLHPVYRLILRWAYIAILTVFAFQDTLIRSVQTVTGGGMGGYVFLVPVAGILAAIGVARRHRTELPIHDRQTDVIVGVMGLVFSLLIHAVLLPRYSLYYNLLRLDLVALWMFVASASVALFGLRPMIRFAWVWCLLFMVFPLPYYIMVFLLGGNKIAGGVGTMIIAGVAIGIAVGRHFTRGVYGSLGGWALGLTILGGLAVFAPDAPLAVYQYLPPLVAICVVGMGMFWFSRRGEPKRLLDRKVEPVAAKQIWSAVPLVLVIAVGLSLVRLPQVGFAPPLHVDNLRFDAPLTMPAGWHVADIQTYDWVRRLYGGDATLVRQKVVADSGDPRFDKFARPRTLMVDTLTTNRPYALNIYPARMLYHLEGSRTSDIKPVSLSFGVSAGMFTVVDDSLLVTWDRIQWTWTNGRTSQRILIIAVDNHEDTAHFPEPTGDLAATLNTMLTVLFRGNAAALDSAPEFKDQLLLIEFANALVRAQLEPLGVKP